jgi:hypothetical protein
MNKISSHDFCRDFVRNENYNLYLLHFFAPRNKRNAILAIMALHTELRFIPQKVQDVTLRLIRLQWWRDEIQKIYDDQPHANSPILDELANSFFGLTKESNQNEQDPLIKSKGDALIKDYLTRFTQSFQGHDADIDESLYALFGHVINDPRANNHFSKKLFLYDNLPDHTIFRAFRLWIGI